MTASDPQPRATPADSPPRSDSFGPSSRMALAVAAIVLFAVRHDVFLGDTTTLVAGLPISLVYHLAYCVLVSVVLALLLRAGR